MQWGMVGVLGEAFNVRHTAYFLGSSGQVWECSASGPRSITALGKLKKNKNGKLQKMIGMKLERRAGGPRSNAALGKTKL